MNEKAIYFSCSLQAGAYIVNKGGNSIEQKTLYKLYLKILCQKIFPFSVRAHRHITDHRDLLTVATVTATPTDTITVTIRIITTQTLPARRKWPPVRANSSLHYKHCI